MHYNQLTSSRSGATTTTTPNDFLWSGKLCHYTIACLWLESVLKTYKLGSHKTRNPYGKKATNGLRIRKKCETILPDQTGGDHNVITSNKWNNSISINCHNSISSGGWRQRLGSSWGGPVDWWHRLFVWRLNFVVVSHRLGKRSHHVLHRPPVFFANPNPKQIVQISISAAGARWLRCQMLDNPAWKIDSLSPRRRLADTSLASAKVPNGHTITPLRVGWSEICRAAGSCVYLQRKASSRVGVAEISI